MPVQLSPGIIATERDLTTVVPGVATSSGGFAGEFQWGPVDQPSLVTSEIDLVNQFGKPDANTYISFFTAANFLGYANRMYVVRTDGGDAANNAGVSSNIGGNASVAYTPERIKNDDAYLGLTPNANVFITAKYPGSIGNSLAIAVVDNGSWDGSVSSIRGLFDVKPNVSTYASTYGNSSAADELHIAVIDQDGLITGQKNTVLEKFQYLSKASDALGSDGRSIYYRTVINEQSSYIRWRSHPVSATGAALNWGNKFTGIGGNTSIVFDQLGTGSANNSPVVSGYLSLAGGSDVSPTADHRATGFSLLENDEVYDISLVPVGDMPAANAKTVIDSLTGDGKRNDVVIFISPEYSDVQSNLADSTKATNVTGYRNSELNNLSSSYKRRHCRIMCPYRFYK